MNNVTHIPSKRMFRDLHDIRADIARKATRRRYEPEIVQNAIRLAISDFVERHAKGGAISKGHNFMRKSKRCGRVFGDAA